MGNTTDGLAKLYQLYQDAWKKVDLNLGAAAWAKEVLGKDWSCGGYRD